MDILTDQRLCYCIAFIAEFMYVRLHIRYIIYNWNLHACIVKLDVYVDILMAFGDYSESVLITSF